MAEEEDRKSLRQSLFDDDDGNHHRPAQSALRKSSSEQKPALKSSLKPTAVVRESVPDTVFSKFVDKPKVAFVDPQEADRAQSPHDSSSQGMKKKANLIIRAEEETRIILALQKAAKKQATGAIFSVVVDIRKNGTLDIGVKDLPESLLVVSLLKRGSGSLGAAEEAGIRLGDVIFGINFIPTREGSKTLVTVIKCETERKKSFVHIQAWRCHQLCSDSVPGYLFPRADDMFVRGYDLAHSKVFTDSERWNFLEILLGYMVEDLQFRAQNSVENIDMHSISFSQTGRVRARQMQALDLEKNILQAKGLRSAINVRIVHTKNGEDASVTYVLRVEDVESGLVWVVLRRYHEFYALYEELNNTTHFLREIDFPRKRLTMRLSQKVIDQRIAMLEHFLRRGLHTLTLYASMDSTASTALRRIQNFLSVEKHVDCLHPPALDDQRTIELLAYRFLNDFNSPACLQCVRFTSSVDLDGLVEAGEDGFRNLLTFMHDALAEVEQFVQQHHEQQLIAVIRSRRPEWTEEQQLRLVRQCIRRQVECALYLPLRRSLVRILLVALETKDRQLSRSLQLLQRAKPSVFMVDPNIVKTKALPRAIKAFRKALLAHLPSDQGQFLVEAAAVISEVFTESKELLRVAKRISMSPTRSSSISTGPSASVQKAAVTTSSSSPAASTGRRLSRAESGTMEDRRGSRSSFTGLRSSLTERLGSLLLPDAMRREGAGVGEGQVEDDMEVGLGEETLRVSFAVATHHSAVVASSPDTTTTTSSIRGPFSATKASGHVPRRDIVGLSGLGSDRPSLTQDDAVRLSFTPEERPLPPVPPPRPDDHESAAGSADEPLPPLLGRETRASTLSTSSLSSLITDSSDLAASTGDDDHDDPYRRLDVGKGKEDDSGGRSPTVLSSSNRLSTRQLERTSSRKTDIVDPLLRPPREDSDTPQIDKELFADVFDMYRARLDSADADADETENVVTAISADDFLPIFTYVVVHAQTPHMMLLKELMVTLISNEDAFGECGYYLATLEAALQHINDLASQFDDVDDSAVQVIPTSRSAEDLFDLRST